MEKVGALFSKSKEKFDDKNLSWGFNQLDEKGAFIVQTHISYPEWGENYGRGLAQSEDRIGFDMLLRGAGATIESSKKEIFKTIEEAIDKARLKDPIVIHSLLSQLEFIGLEQTDIFFAKYRRDCPQTPYNELTAFSGALRLNDRIVPVFFFICPRK